MTNCDSIDNLGLSTMARSKTGVLNN